VKRGQFAVEELTPERQAEEDRLDALVAHIPWVAPPCPVSDCPGVMSRRNERQRIPLCRQDSYCRAHYMLWLQAPECEAGERAQSWHERHMAFLSFETRMAEALRVH
jgi:hypothetical protein